MDEGALRQGVFEFRHRDAIGLPAYEFFMWGFYILHTTRFLAGPTARPRRILWPLGLAAVFSLCFSVISGPTVLAAATGAVLAVSLVLFHEPMDFTFTVYMAVMGALVEYVGVGTGQWSYPRAPGGGPVMVIRDVGWHRIVHPPPSGASPPARVPLKPAGAL